MKKVLIISYFYPPSTFVGGQRTSYWAENLYKYDIYPILITRQWNESQSDLVDPIVNNQYELDRTEKREIHRVPFRRSLRDKCASYKLLKPLQKALSLYELVATNYFLKSFPYFDLYSSARKILQENNDIGTVIISGRPFQTFQIGYQLKKEFPHIQWIPDYRDEWTTHQNQGVQSSISKQILKIERRSEIKWTSNADRFLTVSDYWKGSISELIDKQGHVIMNGYVGDVREPQPTLPDQPLTILYAGSLYSTQKIERFFEVMQRINAQYESHIRLKFIGLNMMPDQLERVRQLGKKFNNINFINRLPSNELQSHMANADVLLLTGFEGVKGWYPVKLFDYFASGKTILLYPGDKDVMEQFVEKSNSGVCPASNDACYLQIESWIQQKMKGEHILYKRNQNYGAYYSREHQTELLAKFLTS